MTCKRFIIISAVISMFGFFANAQDKAHDWAQFYRYAEANSELTEAPNVVLLGNSITDFWVGYDPDFFVNNHLLGRGISGQTTSEMLVRFRQDVINLKPKIVVILAGINDIAENNGPILPENILGNIRSMVELARFHKIQPVLCSLLPTKGFSWRPDIKPAEIVRNFNRQLEAYAKAESIPFVNYYDAMVDSDGGLRSDLTADGCHPNIRGYRIMEPILLKVLNNL